MLASRRGSTLIMYVAVIGIVVSVAVAMRLLVQEAVQAKIVSATVDMLGLPLGSGDGYEAGDGHETQRFGASAMEKMQGFLDEPDIVATSNMTRNMTLGEGLSSGTYQTDQTWTDQRAGVQVSRELLPVIPKGSSASPPPGDDDRRRRPRRYED